MSSKQFATVLTLSLLSVAAPRVAHAQDAPPTVASPDEDRRRALYAEGKAAIKAQHWVDAKKALDQAWAISPSYDVALLLAQAELNLNHYADSARLLAYYFRNVSAKENEKTYANAKKGFERAKQQVSSVTVTAPAGAEVWLDGKAIGSAPLDGAVFVNPGKRMFEVRRGDLKSQREIEAVAGQEQAVSLTLQETPAAATASAARPEASVGAGLSEPMQPVESPPPVDRHDAEQRSLVPIIIGGSATVLALGVGIGFRVAASSSHDDFVRLQQKNGDGGCTSGSASPSDCTAQRDAVDSENSQRRISTTAFVVAGVAAVGTAVYWFWPREATPSGAARGGRLRLSGAVTPAGSGLWLNGSF